MPLPVNYYGDTITQTRLANLGQRNIEAWGVQVSKPGQWGNEGEMAGISKVGLTEKGDASKICVHSGSWRHQVDRALSKAHRGSRLVRGMESAHCLRHHVQCALPKCRSGTVSNRQRSDRHRLDGGKSKGNIPVQRLMEIALDRVRHHLVRAKRLHEKQIHREQSYQRHLGLSRPISVAKGVVIN